MSKRIIHLANDYPGSLVYNKLISELDSLGVEQVIYCAVRSEKLIGKNHVDFKQSRSREYYSYILDLSTRLFFYRKIRRMLLDITSKVNISDYKLIHAHTWFSDGGLAYELKKKYGKPYIVTIRNTDLNLYFKYFIHLKAYGIEILRNATKIIFLSPIYKDRLIALLSTEDILYKIRVDSKIVPNGIDKNWMNNQYPKKTNHDGHLKLLYVGKFTRNKNVVKLLKAVALVNKIGKPCSIKLVGGGGNESKRVVNFIKAARNVSYVGRIDDIEELREVFRGADVFAMPSKSESFGLVYLEALSQGLPIIHTKNEGIDGYYDNVGIAVSPNSVEEIAQGILFVYDNYHSFDFDINTILMNHDWGNIAKIYQHIYGEVK